MPSEECRGHVLGYDGDEEQVASEDLADESEDEADGREARQVQGDAANCGERQPHEQVPRKLVGEQPRRRLLLEFLGAVEGEELPNLVENLSHRRACGNGAQHRASAAGSRQQQRSENRAGKQKPGDRLPGIPSGTAGNEIDAWAGVDAGKSKHRGCGAEQERAWDAEPQGCRVSACGAAEGAESDDLATQPRSLPTAHGQRRECRAAQVQGRGAERNQSE